MLIAEEKNKISIYCILSSLYFLMVPLTISTNSMSASFLKIASIPIGLFFVVSFIFYKKEFNINMVHISLALYTVSTVITLFINNNREDIIYVLGYFLNAALYLCISVVSYNEKELELMDFVQIVLLVILTAIPLFGEKRINERTSLVLFGQESDPNYFVGFFIFPLSVAMKKIYESRYRIIYVILILTSMYVILITGSRGGLLAVGVTVLAFALIYPDGLRKKATIFFLMTIIAIVFFVFISPFLPEMIKERFSVESVVETRGTYRGDIWKAMINEIKASSWEVIFGRGIVSKITLVLNGRESEVVAHNHLLQLLYNQGFIGLLTFCTLIIACIIRCIRKRKHVAVAIIGMMALSISISFGTSTKAFWNIIPYAAFALAQKKDKEIPCENNIPKEEEMI